MLWKFLRIPEFVWVAVALGVLLLLRVGYLNAVPLEAYTPDEAALLLNAELLLEHGIDEWGKSWPLQFASFGDSKLPGYIYSVVITRWLGVEGWIAVRIPSIIGGVVLPVAVWWLVKALGGSRFASYLAAILVIISPWSWHYGTIGYEANLALPIFIFGVTLFLLKPFAWWKEALGAGALFIAILTYNAPLLLLPGVLLLALFWRWPNRALMARAFLFMCLGVGAAAVLTLSATTQKSGISIFTDPTIVSQYPAYRAQFPGIIKTVLGNQWVYFFKLMSGRWFQSWGWEFLVTRGGGNPWHTIPNTGHVSSFVLMLLGLSLPVWLMKAWKTHKTEIRKSMIAVFWLLATSLLPAIITVDAPHATRSLFFFVMLALVAGWGGAVIWEAVSRAWPRWGLFSLSILFWVTGLWLALLWLSPAHVRWTYFVGPRWNAGLLEVLRDSRVQQAEHLYVLDDHGVLYTYAALEDEMLRENFFTSIHRSGADTAGLYQVEQLGKYSFVSEEELPLESTSSSVLLRPRSNTQWDIIEL